MKQQSISWDAFEERYKPIQNHITNREEFNGWMFETYGADDDYIRTLAKTEPNRIWTIIDCDDDLIIVNGWHYVNRFAYVVTEIAFNEDEEIQVDQF